MTIESKEKPGEIFAVDVVILPAENVTEEAIRLSESIGNSPFTLSKTDFRPHITLAMAYVNDLSLVKNVIEQVAKGVSPFRVAMTDVSSRDMVDPAWRGGKFQNSWNMEENNSVSKLHRELVARIPYISMPSDFTNSFVGQRASAAAASYVEGFRMKNSGESYWPHITIGSGDDRLDQTLRREFECSEIVLAQLGDFCTVRKILARFLLRLD